MEFFKVYMMVLAAIGALVSILVGFIWVLMYAVDNWGLTGVHIFFGFCALGFFALVWGITDSIVNPYKKYGVRSDIY